MINVNLKVNLHVCQHAARSLILTKNVRQKMLFYLKIFDLTCPDKLHFFNPRDWWKMVVSK